MKRGSHRLLCKTVYASSMFFASGNKNGRAHQYVADNRLENFHHEGRHRFPVNEITTVTPSHVGLKYL